MKKTFHYSLIFAVIFASTAIAAGTATEKEFSICPSIPDDFCLEDKQLITAVKKGLHEALERILLFHKNVNLEYEEGSLLHHAASEGHLKCAELLVNNGADISATTPHGGTPLHCAAWKGYTDIVQFLLNNNAPINAINFIEQATPLHWAAKQNHTNCIALLLAAGANPTLKNATNKTAADYAEELGHQELAALLRTAEITWQKEHKQKACTIS
ncbi:ankyrin repeat domain-containing protein [bacterium]|nr:MAG: ankyrin repeat domain-containing protein [bacterium]